MEQGMDLGPRIVIESNGPYIVTGLTVLARRERVLNAQGEAVSWANGDDIPVDASVRLCRCGQSRNKPFCDDRHERADFVGTLVADRAPGYTRRRVFEGVGMAMTDDTSLCAGYGFCDRYGGVWNRITGTADPQVRASVQRQISLCPTGRLEYLSGPDGRLVDTQYPPMLAVIPNGPLWVLGGVPVIAPDGYVYEIRNRVTLCRCGQSKNKPFCDGTHWQVNFSG